MSPPRPTCRVCGAQIISGLLYVCPACSTPHHAECWDYSGGCSVYGCEQSRALKLTNPSQLPTPYSPAQRVLLATLLFPGLFCLMFGLGFLGAFNILFAIPTILFGSFLFRRAWKDAIRPFIELNPVLGTFATFVTGITTAILAMTAGSIFLFSFNGGLGSLLIGIVVGIGAVRTGQETRRLFEGLNDETPSLSHSREIPLLNSTDDDAPPVKPPPE